MSDSITVAIRVRPLVKSEQERGCDIAVKRPVDGVPQVTVQSKVSFTFNYVFDGEDTQQHIHESCVRDKLKKLLQGYNVTILAYGQTGSGKTYTMGTAFNGGPDEDMGVIPRAVHDIFEEASARRDECDFKVTCSFLELYQEQLFDLLSPNERYASTVSLREDKQRIVIPGLTEVEVASAKDVTDLLMRGSSRRTVASTAMNEASSRSHAIFILTVVATHKTGNKLVTTSKFNLVDLAGSERCSKTLATGQCFKEGVNINKGLLALGNVITALGSGQSAGHVPYRHSKLTRLLQDSLGGNSITLMIACVSPADYNVNESLTTLRYADRALQIKNKAVVNVDPYVAEIQRLNDIIQKLRVQLMDRNGGNSNEHSNSSMQDSQELSEQLQKLKEANAAIEKKNRVLQQKLQQALIDVADKELRAHIAEVAHEKIKTHLHELKSKLNVSALPQLQPEQRTEQSEQSDALWQQQLREITQLVTCVDDELQQTESVLLTHRNEHLNGSATKEDNEVSGSNLDADSDSEESHAFLQTANEEHTKTQLNLNEELRSINRQLDLKEMLHDRVRRNFNQLADDDSDEKIKQYQQKIDQLESEQRELLDQLRSSKAKDTSSKLAEERRRRLQVLEKEVGEMRRKIVQQANLLKMREKEAQKIKNLSSEIHAMKESKVKLIRAMRGESERFRQFKLNSEKQVTQLKSKDRKMQSEMVRQETLHAKQRQVLKRKCEEAMATNKRLKDALERQRAAQAQRQRHAKDQPSAAKLDELVTHELDVILSLIDAEHSLEQLMEDRAIIYTHCNEIKQAAQTSGQPQDEQAELLASLEEELEMRNAQIADLQQKVCSNDLDSRMRALSENVQSIGELRTIIKQLLKNLVQQRHEQARGAMEQKVLLEEQRTKMNDEFAKHLRQAECKLNEAMLNQQRSYEERAAVLLRSTRPQTEGAGSAEDAERDKLVEDLLRSKEAMQQELDELKSKARKKSAPIQHADMTTTILSMSDSSDENSDNDDPNWVPRAKRAKQSLKQQQANAAVVFSEEKANTSAPNTTNTSDLSLTTTVDDTQKSKSFAKRCKCRQSKCRTKQCGCTALGNGCNQHCMCHGECQNPFNGDNNGDKENSQPATSTPEKDTLANEMDEPNCIALKEVASNAEQQNHIGTPLKHVNSMMDITRRHSELNLNTPSVKKKFF